MARAPMRSVAVPRWWADDAAPAPILIELTAKRWKALMLVSATLMLLGLLIIGWQLWTDVYRPLIDLDQPPRFVAFERFTESMSGPAAWAGWLVLGAAFATGVYARVMAWWRHG